MKRRGGDILRQKINSDNVGLVEMFVGSAGRS
jgi:hypothetical protein